MALLTVAEARKHLPDYPAGTGFDDALQRLLNVAEAAITERVGPVGVLTEWHASAVPFIYPARPVTAVSSVKEIVGTTETTLAANDYRVWPGGWMIERIATGTNPRASWAGRVELAYSSAVDTAQREVVQVQLVQQFLNYNPGVAAETIGEWSQQFRSNSVYNWSTERENILSTLGGRNVVVA